MKKILITLVVTLMCAISASAQWYVYRNSAENPVWLRAYGSFNYGMVKETVNGQSITFNPLGGTGGAMICPNLTFNTLKRMPLFLELGGEVSYMYGHTTDAITVNGQQHVPFGGNDVPLTTNDGTELPTQVVTGGEYTMNMVFVSLPVNLIYYFDLKKNGMAIAPFLGGNFKVNIMSSVTDPLGEKHNMLKNESVNLFQFGVNAGVTAILVRGFTVGYRLQYDIMKYSDSTPSMMMHSLQLGYRF